MSMLSVTVKRARYTGPQAAQLSTYCTLKLQHVKSTTVTVKGSEPCWEQDFLFETEQMDAGLLLEIWSKGLLWDKALGYKWLPLVDIQYAREEGVGQWYPLDSELVMNGGDVVGTRGSTGDSVLLDCRFELPFDMMECDATELQRKLEMLNSVMASESAPPGCGAAGGAGGGGGGGTRHLTLQQISGVSEDSDYTSDIGFPVGQNPNSSASQYLGAANNMGAYMHHQLSPGYSSMGCSANQQQLSPGYGSQGYPGQQEMSPGSGWPEEELYYNSRPNERVPSSQPSSQPSPQPPGGSRSAPFTRNVSETGRRHSLERQTTLYEEQPMDAEPFGDGWPVEQQRYYYHDPYRLETIPHFPTIRETCGEDEAEYNYEQGYDQESYQEYYDEDGNQQYEYYPEGGDASQYDASGYYDEYDPEQYDPAAYGSDPAAQAPPAATSTAYSLPNGPSSGPGADATSHGSAPGATWLSGSQTAYSGSQSDYGDRLSQTLYNSEAQSSFESDALDVRGSARQQGYSETRTAYGEAPLEGKTPGLDCSEPQTGYSDSKVSASADRDFSSTGYSGYQPPKDSEDTDQAAEYYDEETGDYFDGIAWSYYDEDSGQWYYYDDAELDTSAGYTDDYGYGYGTEEQPNLADNFKQAVSADIRQSVPPTIATRDSATTNNQKKPDFGLGNLGFNKLTSSLGQLSQSVGQSVKIAGAATPRAGVAQAAQNTAALGNKAATKTKEVGSMFAGLLRGLGGGGDSKLSSGSASSTPNLTRPASAAAATQRVPPTPPPEARRSLTKHASYDLDGEEAGSATPSPSSPSQPPTPKLTIPSDDAAILASIDRYRGNDPYVRRDEFYTTSDLEQDRALLDGIGVKASPDGMGLVRRESFQQEPVPPSPLTYGARTSLDRHSPLYEETAEGTSSSRDGLSATEASYSPTTKSPTPSPDGTSPTRGSLSSPTLVKSEIDKDKLILGNFEPEAPGRRSKVTTPVSPPRENVIEPHPAYQQTAQEEGGGRSELRLSETEKKVSFEDEQEKPPMTARQRWFWAYEKILLQLNEQETQLTK